MTTETKCPKCGGGIVSKGVIGTDRHNQEMEADWEECEKCGFNPEGFMTPQEQAKAMALAFKLRDFLPEHVIEYMSTEEEDAFVASISTALSKLIAENEMIKKSCEMWANDYADAQSQLTATEAKLKQGIKWMTHKDDCPHWEAYHAGTVANCECGLELFLSTLTAEKKEQG